MIDRLHHALRKLFTNSTFFFFLTVLSIFYGQMNHTFHLPFYWDTGTFLIQNAFKFSNGQNVVEYLSNTGSDYPHTPLLPILYAIVLRIFNDHILYIHALSFIFSFAFLVVMYFFFRNFLSSSVAKIGIFIFLTCPLFLAQTNLSYFEIIGTTLRYLCLLLLFRNKYLLIAIFSITAFFMRFENGFILGLLMLFFFLFTKERKALFVSIVLFFISGFWIVVHRLRADWWFYSPNRYFEENSFSAITTAINYIFISQGRWFFTLLTVALIAYVLLSGKLVGSTISQMIKNHISLTSHALMILVVTLPTIVIIAKLGYFLPRYIIPLLPAYYLLCLFLIQKIISNKIVIIFIVMVGISIQSVNKYQCAAENFEDCWTLINILQVKKEMSNFIEINYSKSNILTSYPEDFELSKPMLGFVSKPLSAQLVGQLNGQTTELIYLSPTSSNDLYSLAKSSRFKPIRIMSIANSGHKLSVYEKINR